MSTISPPAVVPTLSDLCLETIANSMEKYPPHCFSLLAESEWNEIIRKKHRNTAPGQNKAGGASYQISAPVVLSGGLDGRGRTIPAVADKILREIENQNPHLSQSAVSDELVWRDCVEYKFRSGGMARPRVFQYPWPMLVEKLKSSGDALLHVLMPPPSGPDEGGCSEASIRQQREDKMMKSIQFLGHSIMSIELLAQSGVGKAVKKFVKGCKKFVATDGGKSIPRWMPDILAPRPNLRLLSPLQYLDKLLSGWKAVASSSGVQVTASKGGDDQTVVTFAPEQFSGRDKRTSEEEHREDVAVAMTCRQWRQIFQSLANRELANVARYGEKMRRLREDLHSDRPKIGHVGTKSAKSKSVIASTMRKQSRQEEILNKSRGTRARMAAVASGRSGSSGTAKIQALRQEVKQKRSRQGAVGRSGVVRSRTAPTMRQTAGASKKNTSFGASVAAFSSSSSSSSAVTSKRAPNASSSARGMVGSVGSRQVELSGGKRMGLPKQPIASKRFGVFAAIEEKKRKAAATEAYAAKQRRANDMTPRFKKR
mmetsp:Transcript_15821/g.45586  ORF Transcript_15821/g.45586 Transcript_15821/m.45586 type:complete len:540 (+) Transcript_15821:116-1735(+)